MFNKKNVAILNYVYGKLRNYINKNRNETFVYHFFS